MVGASEGLGGGGLAWGGAIDLVRSLEVVKDMTFELDELVGLQVGILEKEPFPSWTPGLELEADIQSELSQLVTVKIFDLGEALHLLENPFNMLLLMCLKDLVFPL